MIFAQQRDDDLGPPHLDLPNVGGDQLGVVDGRIVSDVPADRIENNGFDLWRRHAGHRPGGLRLSLDQGGGHIVAIPRAALAAVARAHAIAAVIEDAARQRSFPARPGRAIAVVLLYKSQLNCLEQITIQNGWMLSWADLAPEDHFADVEPVAQEIGERASGEGDAANGPPIRELADFGDDAALPKVGQQ